MGSVLINKVSSDMTHNIPNGNLELLSIINMCKIYIEYLF